MKAVLVTAGAWLLMSGVALASEVKETIRVSGWHCEGCAGKTAAAVKRLHGVKDAAADVDGKTLTVEYDDAVIKHADIEGTIMALHYKVQK